MYINLFDFYREELLPLTFIRPIGNLRCGILTFKERWEHIIKNCFIGFKTINYLQKKYCLIRSNDVYFINASIIPNQEFISSLLSLQFNQALYYNNIILAYRINNNLSSSFIKFKIILFNKTIYIIKNPWDLFTYNSIALEFDFELLTKNRVSQLISKTNGVIGNKNRIFLEKGAKVEYCTLNSLEGSIYVGKNAEIMEGSHIRGGFSLGNTSIVSMGSKIYGATTIGAFSKVGGELCNVIIFDYSNKKHDGFLGNSIIGYWCNLGANTNCSNLKNNYKKVECWSYKENKKISTNLQFCGTIFGDFSKTAINTQLNTGTVIGIFCSILDYKLICNHVSSFLYSNGGENLKKFTLLEVFELCQCIMSRRDVALSEEDKMIIQYLYKLMFKN